MAGAAITELIIGITMDTKKRDADIYLRDHPSLRKWINQCATCNRQGHKPELPLNIPDSAAPKNLRSFFPLLELNAEGLCDQCALAYKSIQS
jgi:hypothetical protein